MPPIVDLFSAASKPMPMVDYFPSRPLPFAATLVPLDPNTSLPAKLPKPKRHREPIPKEFPSPPYHQRHVSAKALTENLKDLAFDSKHKSTIVGTDEWMQEKIYKCAEDSQTTGSLDISRLGLESLSTKIADLRDLVATPLATSPCVDLSGHESPFATRSKPFGRVSTAPPTASSFINNVNQSRERDPLCQSPISRSPVRGVEAREQVTPTKSHVSLMPSAMLSNGSPGKTKGPRKSIERSRTGLSSLGPTQALPVQLFGSQNKLTNLPSALFEATNLTVLTLRNNRLTSLPAAIGELHNLKELNIANNSIIELPSTILSLNLDLFIVQPNPFRKPEAPETQLGPLIRFYDSSVPRLKDLCMSILISPRQPYNYPPFLDKYYWDLPRRGIPHPLLDAAIMHEMIPNITEEDIKRILQLFRSFSNELVRQRRAQPLKFQDFADPFPRSHRAPPPDNASDNPYYYHCPSHRHFEMDTETSCSPSRHLFLQSAEERVEWREIFGEKNLPVRWKGCSPGCLAFLEDEEEWSIDEAEDQEIRL
nr:hypothetical protein L203_06511 [Cryptococcus depauperatus CBS 7841]